MLTLRALLAAHPTLLLIDSASSRIQVGLFRADAEPLWETADQEAGVAVFAGTEKLLARSALTFADLAAFAFCDGPGSVLGIRTAAVALRTWRVLHPRPTFSFCSLALVAQTLRQAENAQSFSVIADARRDTWHRIAVDATGALSPLQRVSTNQLSGSLVMPAHFRHWSALPAGVRTVPYDLAASFVTLRDIPLFTTAPEPDAFLHEEPAYQTWHPQIHRAPTA